MVVPTAYMGGATYFGQLLRNDCQIEVMESFEKQTFRNRCIIQDANRQEVCLTVPVRKAEHKQLTRDIEISYQARWQHQHLITLTSAFRNTPYFDYYADYFLPLYRTPVKWLIDLNDRLTNIILSLLRNEPPENIQPLPHTTDWCGETWTDRHPWQKEKSIINLLFEYGPQTVNYI